MYVCVCNVIKCLQLSIEHNLTKMFFRLYLKPFHIYHNMFTVSARFRYFVQQTTLLMQNTEFNDTVLMLVNHKIDDFRLDFAFFFGLMKMLRVC